MGTSTFMRAQPQQAVLAQGDTSTTSPKDSYTRAGCSLLFRWFLFGCAQRGMHMCVPSMNVA